MTPAFQGFEGWMGDLEAAFEEVATSSLGFGDLGAPVRRAAPPEGHGGSYLALVGPAGALEIGVAADGAGRQALAKALLGSDPAGPDLPDAEVADALSEVVNILAGGFKARLRDRVSPLRIGVPAFFDDPAQPAGRGAVAVSELRVAAWSVALLLIHRRAGSEA